jgi:hypothetical protein
MVILKLPQLPGPLELQSLDFKRQSFLLGRIFEAVKNIEIEREADRDCSLPGIADSLKGLQTAKGNRKI